MEIPPPVLPKRKIEGISAILLPFMPNGSVDWDGFRAHVVRTADAGLFPAVNMDTGYANLIDDSTRQEVLRQTAAVLAGDPFYAGIYVGDRPGDAFNLAGYAKQIDVCQTFNGIPVIFQSYGLTGQASTDLVQAYADIGRYTQRFVAFELGTMFAPFGKIYDLDIYEGLLNIQACVGAKHSSLNRQLEWE